MSTDIKEVVVRPEVAEQPKEIVRDAEMLRLLCQGLTMMECSKIMGWSYVTIRKACKRQEFLAKLKEFNIEVYERVDEEIKAGKFNIAKRIEEAASEALDQMLSLARGAKAESIKYKACQDLMDREPAASRTRKVETGTSFYMPVSVQVLQATAIALKEEQDYMKKIEEDKALAAKVVEGQRVN